MEKILKQWNQHQHYDENEHVEKISPKKLTTQPLVTGTSVLGLVFDGGVMIAADCLGSYGSLAKFRSIQRISKIGDYTAIGASGEISDFQYITSMLNKEIDKEFNYDDGATLDPSEIFQYLVRQMYERRNKFDPLYNVLVVGGFKNNKPFLGYTNLQGTHYEDYTVATGYGDYIARPLLRKHYDEKKGKISKDDAKKILEESMRVLFYRDARAINKIQIATIDSKGVHVSEPYSVSTKWDYKNFS